MEIATLEKLGASSWCEGIIGDGCGGGRIFFTCKDAVKTYDPFTKEVMTLVLHLESPQNISKKGCQIFFTCKQKKMGFDLSKMQLFLTRDLPNS